MLSNPICACIYNMYIYIDKTLFKSNKPIGALKWYITVSLNINDNKNMKS